MILKKYPIKLPDRDFRFLTINYNVRGSRAKRLTIDINNSKAFFKYEGEDYIVSEACSEKMCYEIAKVLSLPCAKIELAYDEESNLGVLNYLFNDITYQEHIDAISFLKRDNMTRKDFYTLSNIKKELDTKDKNLFAGFIKIMIFDCLVGEQDRHEENWGLLEQNKQYDISPLYDNGCNLLREFKDESYAKVYYEGKKDFNAYINRSRTLIYDENHKNRYKHFELIEFIKKNYKEDFKKAKIDLTKLTNEKIDEIVDSIPDALISEEHKNFIKKYLIIRRDKLQKILDGDDYNEM